MLEQLYLGGLALVAGALCYRLVWQRRFRAPPERGSGAVRVVGTVAGPGPAGEPIPVPGSFELRGAGREQDETRVVYLDCLADLASKGRPPRVGERVTVDGVSRQVPGPAGETLYRQQGLVSGLDATRVVTGAWPRLRWLVPAASLLTLGLVVLAVARPYWGVPEQLFVERTAEAARCPEGTVRETRVGPDGVLHRCRDEAGELHGIYTIWGWHGRLVERGQWWHGRRQGLRDVRVADRLRRSHWHEGRLHGPTFVLVHPFSRFERRSYHAEYVRGRLNGIERGWYENGKPAFVHFFYEGQPRGKWTRWDRAGRIVARGAPADVR